MNIFRNFEIKRIMINITIIYVLIALIAVNTFNYKINNAKRVLVNQNINMVSDLINKHPDLEIDIINSLTRKNYKNTDFNVLNKYGYNSDIFIENVPAMGELNNSLRRDLGKLLILGYLSFLVIIFYNYKLIFKKVNMLSAGAEEIISGNFKVKIKEGEEGDFSILAHNFNNMARILESTMSKLKDDKIFLKNVISDISHQLKTPLASLILFNELLSRDNLKIEDRKRFCEKGMEQLDRMEWLIKSLLKLAKLESNSIEFQKKEIPIKYTIEKSISSLKNMIDDKNQILSVSYNNDDIRLCHDSNWTCEALINIIKNCIEHTSELGKITIKVEDNPIFVRIIIKDNGCGINKCDIPHIFERFYRGKYNKNSNSVGIGLALSKAIIERQNGNIVVRSEEGKGSEFIITFLKAII